MGRGVHGNLAERHLVFSFASLKTGLFYFRFSPLSPSRQLLEKERNGEKKIRNRKKFYCRRAVRGRAGRRRACDLCRSLRRAIVWNMFDLAAPTPHSPTPHMYIIFSFFFFFVSVSHVTLDRLLYRGMILFVWGGMVSGLFVVHLQPWRGVAIQALFPSRVSIGHPCRRTWFRVIPLFVSPLSYVPRPLLQGLCIEARSDVRVTFGSYDVIAFFRRSFKNSAVAFEARLFILSVCWRRRTWLIAG
jgi:hypothetical protein